MAKTTEKIVLSILVILFFGMAIVLIAALGTSNSLTPVETVREKPIMEISLEEAALIATQALPGILKDVDIIEKNGQAYYEVEIMDGDIEREILLSTHGDILSVRVEEEEEEENISTEELKTIGGIITEAQASKIATEEVNGRVTDISVEREDGTLIYEIELKSGSDFVEVEINAETGEIIEI